MHSKKYKLQIKWIIMHSYLFQDRHKTFEVIKQRAFMQIISADPKIHECRFVIIVLVNAFPFPK